MSRTIEQKVVEMRFDNSNFEKNVSQSMNTLDKLKTAIDKTSSANAFSGLAKAVDNLDFGGVTTAIQTVTEKFSIWEQMAIGAVRNVGAQISNFLTTKLKPLTTANFEAGFAKYGTKTEAIQTIMASIADQDFGDLDKMEYVEGLMEKLNWFTDETSYNLTDMISSIGKFTSAGVDLDKASNAMMGIANWAAVSGQNAAGASRVMYQLSQSLGMGAVRVQDWMSVETANMATKEFKELAIQVAKAKGEIMGNGMAKNATKSSEVITFQNFRSTLKDNWLTSDVLVETLNQYSGFSNALSRVYDAYAADNREKLTSEIIPQLKEAQEEAKATGKTLEEVFKEKHKLNVDFSVVDKNGKVIDNLANHITDLGIRAFAAAQEAKTMEEAFNAVSDAASTVWMSVFETIFGNYEKAKVLWTNLANDMWDLFVGPIVEIRDAVQEWDNKFKGRLDLFGTGEGGEELGAMYMLMESILNIQQALTAAFESTFGKLTGKKIKDLTERFQNFVKRIYVTEDEIENLTEKFKKFLKPVQFVVETFTKFNERTKFFTNLMDGAKNIIDRIRISFNDTFGPKSSFSHIYSIAWNIRDAFDGFFETFKINDGVLNRFEEIFEHLGIVAQKVDGYFKPFRLALRDLRKVMQSLGSYLSGEFLANLLGIPEGIVKLVENTELVDKVIGAFTGTLESVKTGFSEAFDSDVFTDIKNSLGVVFSAVETFIKGFELNEGFFSNVKTIAGGFASAINLVGRAVQFLLIPLRALVDYGVFDSIAKFLSGPVLNALMFIPTTIAKIVTKIDEFLAEHPSVVKFLEDISMMFAQSVGFVLDLATSFGNFIFELNPLSKVAGGVKTFFGAFKESEVVTKIIEKLSGAFSSIRDFFRDKLRSKGFIDEIKGVGDSISNFIDQSELLSSIRNVFSKLWGYISGMFSGSGLSSFVSGFDGLAKGIWGAMKSIGSALKSGWESVSDFVKNSKVLGSLKTALTGFFGWLSGKVDEWFTQKEGGKGFFASIADFFKGIFGKGDSGEVSGVEGEVESFGQKIQKILGGIWKAVIWLGEKVKSLFGAIKNVWENLGIGEWFSELISNIGNFFKGLTKKSDPVEKAASKITTSLSGVQTNFADILSDGIGILGTAIPAVIGYKLVRGLEVLMSPFTALQEIVEAFSSKMKKEGTASLLLAIGESFKNIAKSLGIFLVAIAATVGILAIVDKYSGGNLLGIFGALTVFIGEVLGLILTLAKQLTGFAKTSVNANADIKDATGKIGGSSSSSVTADNLNAISNIFFSIGASMLMFAATVGAMAYIINKFGGAEKVFWPVMGAISGFLILLTALALLVSKYATEEETLGASFEWGKGLSVNKNGYADGLFSLGKFMLMASGAVLLLASAAASIVKVSNGDTTVMNSAFQGIQGILFVTMGMVAAIVYASSRMPENNANNASKAIKSAATALVGAGVAIRLISKVVAELGKAKKTELDQGLLAMEKIGLVLLAFGFVSGMADNNHMTSAGLMLIEAAAAIGIMAMVVKKLGELDTTKLNQGLDALKIFGIVLVAMEAITGLANNNNMVGAGVMLVAAAASMAILANGMAKLAELDSAPLGKAIAGLIVSVLSLGALFSLVSLLAKDTMDTEKFVVAAVGMLAIAGAVVAVANTIADIGVVFAKNEGAMGKGLLTLLAIVAGLTILGAVAYATGPAMLIFGAGIAAIGLGIGVLALGFASFVNTMILLAGESALFGSALINSFGTFLDGLLGLEDKIVKALTMLFRIIGKSIKESAKEIVSGFLSVFIGVLEAIAENVDKIIDLLGRILDKAIPFLIDKLGMLLDLLLPVINNFLLGENGILAIVNEAINGENGLLSILNTALFGEAGLLYMINELINGEKGILAIINTAINGETGILSMLNIMLFGETGILSLIGLAINGEGGILAIIDTALFGEHGIISLIDKLINGETGILSILDTAINGETGILAIIDKAILTLLDNIEGQAPEFRETFTTVLKEAAKAITDAEDTIFETVETLITDTAAHIVSLADTIMQAVIDLIEGLATSIETHSGDFWAAVGHLVKAIWNSIWGIFGGTGENSLDNLGANFMDGFGQGLISHVQSAIDKAKEVGGKVLQGIKDFFGIKSPSRVMAEIGGFLDEGLAIGIGDNSDSPLNAVDSLGSSLTDSFSNAFGGIDLESMIGGTDMSIGDNITNSMTDALGGMTDILNTEDFTPTITPVLDLSEVQNGASQIPGMLNSGASYTVDTSNVAKSAYNPYEYYDGTVKVTPEETQMGYFEALQAKMEEIVNKFGKAKVVLDTGAVVGGLVGPMDNALGQRMVQAGRGVYQS